MAVAFVQSVSQQFGSSGSPQALAYPGGLGSGHLLIVAVTTFASPTVTVAVTDSLGQTWVQAGSYRDNSAERCSIWYVGNSTAGACTVTVTPSGTCLMTIAVHEYSGVQTAAPLSGTNGNVGWYTDAAPTTDVVSIGAAGDLVFAVYGQGTRVIGSAAADAPFTLRESQLDGATFSGIGTSDDINAPAGEAGSFTLGNIVAWCAAGASFLQAAPVVPVKTYAPEIRTGPPMRGAPWLRRLPIAPAAVGLPPPPPPAVPLFLMPEVTGGPPMRGSPFTKHLPILPSLPQRSPLPKKGINLYAPEVHRGPPMRGAPWLQHLPVERTDLQGVPPQIGQQTYAPEVGRGPPIPGSPWTAIRVVSNVVVLPPTSPDAPVDPDLPPPPPPPPPDPPDGGGSGGTALPGTLLPILGRDPKQDARTRRFTEVLSNVMNSLRAGGTLVEIAPGQWAIRASRFEEGRPPGPADDQTVGAYVGAVWIDSNTNNAYVCVRDSLGSAVWRLITP